MVRRLSCSKCYPIWLWTERPDLRRRWYAEKGATFVLLQVSIEESKVLLSEYYLWHSVLNNWTLELYEGEKVEKEASWERIFDLDLIKSSPRFLDGDDNRLCLQGVTPAIDIDHIKEIKTFLIRF